ncbi:pyridoxal phosphate-dependent decarboxylase family protein [Aureitalea marina]|uniref:Pyridoxal-dependent decarboxylase n=1 Tax=Aureitalea marina TaxID=930804 RepID=A0A2S7KRL6_9FLAO|nr:aminotransferase class I/II-fold pyridoxal phosphate-dependent enzyme [Aureitalea marina]PQB05260.1 pyridoxal-dependent decarboxylase [Aureitalea marina]
MSTPILHQAYNPTVFHENGQAVLDMLHKHLTKMQDPGPTKVIDYIDPEEEYQFWKDHFPKQEKLTEFLETVLNRSIHIHHPGYIGHQVAPAVPASAVGTWMSDLMNNGSAVYEMGAANAALERLVCEYLREPLGWQQGDGFLTSGGTLANLTALLAARKAKSNTDVWSKGQSTPLAIMVSEQAHYCVDRAARIMGLGDLGLIKVPVDDQYRIKTQELEPLYEQAMNQGIQVIAMVGNAPSTATGIHDDLVALGKFAQNHDLWFHVDSAHGGAALYSDQYSFLLEGAAKADSIIIDGHKMMGTSSITTAVLFKNASHSYATFQQDAHYLWEAQEDPEWFNMGKRTFECTKSMMSLRFLSIVAEHGWSFFNDLVNTLYASGQSFAQKIVEHPDMELALEPQTNIVCFRFKSSQKNLDQLNQQIRKAIIEDGRYYIVAVQLKDGYYLRTTFMNPFTTSAHMDELIDLIISKAEHLK